MSVAPATWKTRQIQGQSELHSEALFHIFFLKLISDFFLMLCRLSARTKLPFLSLSFKIKKKIKQDKRGHFARHDVLLDSPTSSSWLSPGHPEEGRL